MKAARSWRARARRRSRLAQDYPTKPVTVVVPWPAGGPSDIAARPVAKALTDQLGKPFVIDNRGGASGNIGTAIVAKQQPADGYTLLITSSSPIVINPSLYKSMPYDSQKDLLPITNVLRVPLVLAVHPSVPAKNLKELLAYINAQKGKFAVRLGGQRHAAAPDGRALQDRRQAGRGARARTRARRRCSPT